MLSSDDALELQAVPPSLIIVGGGVIGCELAFIYRAFGSKVTVVEGQNRVLPLPSVDEEISRLLQREMKKKGIAVELSHTVSRVTPCDGRHNAHRDRRLRGDRHVSVRGGGQPSRPAHA